MLNVWEESTICCLFKQLWAPPRQQSFLHPRQQYFFKNLYKTIAKAENLEDKRQLSLFDNV